MFPAATFMVKQCETSTIVKIHIRFIGEIFEIVAGVGSKNRDGVPGPRPSVRALIVMERSWARGQHTALVADRHVQHIHPSPTPSTCY
jgi:hypothetical protein